MTKIDNIRGMGYEVNTAFNVEEDGETIEVFRVEGFGLSTMVRSDDIEQLTIIENPEHHEERVKQQEETLEETMERLANEETI